MRDKSQFFFPEGELERNHEDTETPECGEQLGVRVSQVPGLMVCGNCDFGLCDYFDHISLHIHMYTSCMFFFPSRINVWECSFTLHFPTAWFSFSAPPPQSKHLAQYCRLPP